MRNIEWFKVVPNLNDKIYRIQKSSYSNFYSVEHYLDYYEKTGLEIDERCTVLDLVEDLLETFFIQLLPFIKGLPGMKDVKKKDFFRDFLCSGSLAHLALSRDNICSFDGDFYVTDLNGSKVLTKLETIKAFVSDKMLIFKQKAYKIVQDTNLTDEEFMFICALNLLSPHRRIPELSIHYKRIVLAFTRYLTTTYGNNYIKKFQTIISLMFHYNQAQMVRNRISKRSDKYFDTVFKKPIVKAMYGIGNLDEQVKQITFTDFERNLPLLE